MSTLKPRKLLKNKWRIFDFLPIIIIFAFAMESVKQIILKYAKPDEELNANLLREAVAPLYGVSKPVINSCLAQLSKSGQISRISRGVYTIAKEKITFAP